MFANIIAEHCEHVPPLAIQKFKRYLLGVNSYN